MNWLITVIIIELQQLVDSFQHANATSSCSYMCERQQLADALIFMIGMAVDIWNMTQRFVYYATIREAENSAELNFQIQADRNKLIKAEKVFLYTICVKNLLYYHHMLT